MTKPTPLLEVRQLQVSIPTASGVAKVVDGVDFTLEAGKSLGVVGESGSGKSMTCAALLNLLPKGGSISAGEVLFKGQDLLKQSPQVLQKVRGREIGMILQDPMTSLNPLFSIGKQIAEVFKYQSKGLGSKLRRSRVVDVMRRVQIPAAEDRYSAFPHQFSGGMRQRIGIAINIAGQPDLLIADEPTTALDVTIRQQILKLLKSIQQERSTAIILVSHDLQSVVRLCDDVAIMYAGRIVEQGPAKEVFANPQHPYTQGLLAATPSLRNADQRLVEIPGQPPQAGKYGQGCRFANRCQFADQRCRDDYPEPTQKSNAAQVSGTASMRTVACWYPLEVNH